MKTINNFINGLVFGFDVGTGSIGWAVRRGSEFLDVGVLICDSEAGDLSNRRTLRRQRRTLRSRNYRQKWFAGELDKLGILRPTNFLQDPISLRLRALNGERLAPEELHAALTHLFKRRGYKEVPWANREIGLKNNEQAKEEGDVKKAVSEIRKQMADANCRYPCILASLGRGAIPMLLQTFDRHVEDGAVGPAGIVKMPPLGLEKNQAGLFFTPPDCATLRTLNGF